LVKKERPSDVFRRRTLTVMANAHDP